jgi:hypothetical protein
LSRARKKIQDFLYKKNNNTEEKKRRFLFILFAINGNYIDKIYSKNFSNFAIEPQTKLDIASVSNQYSIPKSLKSTGFLTKNIQYLTLGSIFLIAVVFYFFAQKNHSISDVKQVEKSTIIIDKKATIIADSVNKIETIAIPKTNEKQVAKPVINTSKITKSVVNQVLDTVKPKPIIIKKQIIVRDTVYVR